MAATRFSLGPSIRAASRRLVRALFVALGVSLIVFALVRALPGDPALVLAGTEATPASVERLRVLLGLDGTILEQLVDYLAALLRGDLGTSLASNQPVVNILADSLPVTLWLIAMAACVAVVVAVPLGLAMALREDSWYARGFDIVASTLLAMPIFYSGLILILVASIGLGIAPVGGYRDEVPENLEYLWLPSLTLCTVLVPVLARVMRSSVAQTMQEEFVDAAIVRGLPQRIFRWRYLIRPSIAPTIALLTYIAGQLLGSAVLVETVFGLPGIGTALVDAVRIRDYAAIQGIVFFFGILVVFLGLIGDLVSGWLDPRVRLAS